MDAEQTDVRSECRRSTLSNSDTFLLRDWRSPWSPHLKDRRLRPRIFNTTTTFPPNYQLDPSSKHSSRSSAKRLFSVLCSLYLYKTQSKHLAIMSGAPASKHKVADLVGFYPVLRMPWLHFIAYLTSHSHWPLSVVARSSLPKTKCQGSWRRGRSMPPISHWQELVLQDACT